jgi:8-oxo-dGTP pyrophosphatase MutT (NUDIX family)
MKSTAWIVLWHVHRDGKVRFLVQRRSNDARRNSPGELCFPGGKVKYNEMGDETAVRELREETGIVVKPDDLECAGIIPTNNNTVELIVYTLRVGNDIRYRKCVPHPTSRIELDLDWGGNGHWWMTIDEIKKIPVKQDQNGPGRIAISDFMSIALYAMYRAAVRDEVEPLSSALGDFVMWLRQVLSVKYKDMYHRHCKHIVSSTGAVALV